MGRILRSALRFFDEDNWQYNQDDTIPMLTMLFTGENGMWACYAHAREEQEQFVFYSICPVTSPVDQIPSVTEFLVRANDNLVIGNFALDFDDGQISFKTSVDVEGTELSQPLIRQLVYNNVQTMDKFLPGIMSVTFGHTSPVDALNAIIESLSSS